MVHPVVVYTPNLLKVESSAPKQMSNPLGSLQAADQDLHIIACYALGEDSAFCDRWEDADLVEAA